MRAVLWCNGETPSKELVAPLLEDTVIYGVDGGAVKAVAAGYEVSEVLGDLDSIDPSEWDGKSTHLSDDSSSDLAKSLGLLQTRGFTEVDVVGIDGGSPDHILGTWAALTEAPMGLDIRVHHAGGITIIAHPEDGALELLIPKGDEFSIFALESCQTVTIEGARWELRGESLSFSTRGLHNESLGEPISISADGILAVIIHT